MEMCVYINLPKCRLPPNLLKFARKVFFNFNFLTFLRALLDKHVQGGLCYAS